MCDLEVLGIQADEATTRTLNDFCRSGCHVATLKLQVKSLDALKAACQRLELEFREGQETYIWFGSFMGDAPLPEGFTQEDLGKCQHAIHVPGANYEIGVVYRDGAWRLLWDSWRSGGLEAALGKDCNKLRQAYGVAAAILEAQRQGYSIWEEAQEDGGVKLHVQVGD
jgi:hypothetical protein